MWIKKEERDSLIKSQVQLFELIDGIEYVLDHMQRGSDDKRLLESVYRTVWGGEEDE